MLSTCLPHCIHGANSFSKGSLTQATLRKPETRACRNQSLRKYIKFCRKGLRSFNICKILWEICKCE